MDTQTLMPPPEESTRFWLVVETHSSKKGQTVPEVSYSFVTARKSRAELDKCIECDCATARRTHIMCQEGRGNLQLFYDGAVVLGHTTSTKPLVQDREKAAEEFQRAHSLIFAGDFVRMCGKVYPVCKFPVADPAANLAANLAADPLAKPTTQCHTISDDDPLWAELGLE